jgi:hypothetical protein
VIDLLQGLDLRRNIGPASGKVVLEVAAQALLGTTDEAIVVFPAARFSGHAFQSVFEASLARGLQSDDHALPSQERFLSLGYDGVDLERVQEIAEEALLLLGWACECMERGCMGVSFNIAALIK